MSERKYCSALRARKIDRQVDFPTRVQAYQVVSGGVRWFQAVLGGFRRILGGFRRFLGGFTCRRFQAVLGEFQVDSGGVRWFLGGVSRFQVV